MPLARVVLVSLRILKGKLMNWDQIEVKWAAMTRRVRSDLPRNVQQRSSGPDAVPLATPSGDLPELPKTEIAKAG